MVLHYPLHLTDCLCKTYVAYMQWKVTCKIYIFRDTVLDAGMYKTCSKKTALDIVAFLADACYIGREPGVKYKPNMNCIKSIAISSDIYDNTQNYMLALLFTNIA